MDLEDLLWDYPEPPKDEEWRARRMAEFFPFVAEELSRADKDLLLRELERMNLPEERKELIRMVCEGEEHGKRDTD